MEKKDRQPQEPQQPQQQQLMLLPYLIDWWNETQSIECIAQAIVTNENNPQDFWISCTTYIAHGTFVLDKETKRPIQIRSCDTFNYHPFDNIPIPGYGHIGDGDYVVFTGDGDELLEQQQQKEEQQTRRKEEVWFGLEDSKNPRILHGAIVRYDAQTLEFLGVHPHPVVTTMAFVAYDSIRNLAYSMNWTNNERSLLIFDGDTLEWKNETLPVEQQEQQPTTTTTTTTISDDFRYIQGSDMLNDTLFLMGDDYQSTLYRIELSFSLPESSSSISSSSISTSSAAAWNLKATLVSSWKLGLGHEREGIAIYDNFRNPNCQLLTMNNQWYTWEDQHYAGIMCVGTTYDNQEKEDTNTAMVVMGSISSGVLGVFVGLCLGLILPKLFERLTPTRRRNQRQRQRRTLRRWDETNYSFVNSSTQREQEQEHDDDDEEDEYDDNAHDEPTEEANHDASLELT